MKRSSYLRPLFNDYGWFNEGGYGLYREQSGDNNRKADDITNF